MNVEELHLYHEQPVFELVVQFVQAFEVVAGPCCGYDACVRQGQHLQLTPYLSKLVQRTVSLNVRVDAYLGHPLKPHAAFCSCDQPNCVGHVTSFAL